MVLSGEKQIVNVCDKNWTINKSPKGQWSLTWVQHAQKVKYGLQSRQVTPNNWPNFEQEILHLLMLSASFIKIW